MAKISLYQTESYQLETLRPIIARHFACWKPKLGPGSKVVIKPNLIMRCKPDRAATTHPSIVEAVALELLALGVTDITIADSPGGLYTPAILGAAYQTTGMADVAGRLGLKLNTGCGSQKVRVEGTLCREFDVIDPVVQADAVVNLCKLKTHCMTTLSCGVKNLFGCVPGLLKPELHYRFPDGERFGKMLVDLSQLVRPTLTIVDGVIAMEGDGPTGGSPRKMGFTAAADFENLYALDLMMAHLIGLKPENVSYLKNAIKRGLCPETEAQVEVEGDSISPTLDFKMPSSKSLDFTGNLPAPLSFLVGRLKERLAPKPIIRKKDCVGCGRCAESCPAKTIILEGGKAHIQPSQCIRCFCCHEMCPVKAIDIRVPSIFHWFSR